MVKKVEIENYGSIFLNGIDFKDNEGIAVDKSGNPLTRFTDGSRAKSGWKDKDGNIVSNKEVCRKMKDNNGEDIIVDKFSITKKVDKADYKEKSKSEADYDFNNGKDRKVYVVNTDSKDLRALLDDNKSLVFPFVAGFGHKAWKGILRQHITKKGKKVYTLGLTRGNLDSAFDSFADEPIEIEIGMTGNNENVKKFVNLDE